MLFVVLFFFTNPIYAQTGTQKVDSLKIALHKPENFKIKNDIIYKIIKSFYNADSMLFYNNMGLKNSKNIDNEWYAKFLSLKNLTFKKTERDSIYYYHQKALSIAKDNETKAFIYAEITFHHYQYNEVDSTKFYLKKLEKLKSKDLNILADKFFTEAWIYEMEEAYEKAIAYYNKAIDISQKINNRDIFYRYYHSLALVYFDIGNIDAAAETLKKGLLHIKPNTYGYGRTYTLLAYMNESINKKDTINVKYRELAVSTYLKTDLESKYIAYAYENLSYGYLLLEMNKKALKAIKKIKEYGNKSDQENEHKTAYNLLLGTYYNNINKLDSSEIYLNKTLKFAEDKIESERYVNYSYYQLGLLNFKKKRYNNAKDYFLKVIELPEYKLMSVEQLYKINKEQNNDRQALKRLEQLTIIKDSVANTKTENVLQRFNIKFKTKEKENELLATKLENNKKDKQLASQKRKSQFIIITISFITLLLIIIFFTYKRKKELKLKLELEKKKEFIAEKNNILENLSHEIRTPITIINGYLHLINQQKTKPYAVEKFAKFANNNSNMLLSKFNDFLSTLSISKNKLTIQKEKQQLTPFFDHIISSFEGYALLKNISIFYKYNFKDTTSLDFDFDKLHKIITNLISNSIKYSSPHKNIYVDISLQENSFILVVKDEGFGIPKEEHKLIFDRFYQSKKHKISGGFGIGLSFVKELVQLLKGTITLESKEGIGSIFTVTFPLETNQVNLHIKSLKSAYKIINEHKEEQTAIESNLPKVLVVEDNLDLIIYLKEIFSKHYHCVFVHNGEEALLTVKENSFDLIISDYKMPVMDGLVLKNELNTIEAYKDVPFLLLTAFSFDNYEDIKLRLGLEDYVSKPFTYQEIITRTRKLLENTVHVKNIKSLDNSVKLDSHIVVLIEKTKRYVLENLSNSEYSISDLASDCNYSQKQLGKVIKAYTALTLVQLILEIRLQKAYELILNNKYPTLMEVIYAVGLNNRSYFNKKFKERFGVVPSDLQHKK